MVTRREQYRYDKWLDSLKDSNYDLFSKVATEKIQAKIVTWYILGILTGIFVLIVAITSAIFL